MSAAMEQRPVPAGLERFVGQDPIVAAFVRSYQCGDCTEVELWRGLALLQTEAKMEAIRLATKATAIVGLPVQVVLDAADVDRMCGSLGISPPTVLK